jgi:hypothetical protein
MLRACDGQPLPRCKELPDVKNASLLFFEGFFELHASPHRASEGPYVDLGGELFPPRGTHQLGSHKADCARERGGGKARESDGRKESEGRTESEGREAKRRKGGEGRKVKEGRKVEEGREEGRKVEEGREGRWKRVKGGGGKRKVARRAARSCHAEFKGCERATQVTHHEIENKMLMMVIALRASYHDLKLCTCE